LEYDISNTTKVTIILMEDNILDFFPEDHDRQSYKGKMTIIKSFYFETPARLYAVRLKEANIPSFVSNTSTALPFGNGSITLHIRGEDYERAAEIIRQLDEQNLKADTRDENESFRDADLEDIAYQKAINENNNKVVTPALVIIGIIIILGLIIQFVMNYPGESWR